MKTNEQIKKLRESSKKRKFNQRFDLIITLKDLDLKKAESQIDELFVLPKIPGKPSSVTLFADSVKKLEKARVVSGEEIQKLAENKKDFKKMIKETSIFLSEPKLMPVVGKHLGKFLAPVGKMPKPLVGDIQKTVEDFERGIKIKTSKQPMIQMCIGSEEMKDEDVAENIDAILNFLKTRLSKGKNNISKVYLKLSMGKPMKIEGW
ncbi:MAG: 50S ribosomal protein L1 [Candidatus Aenigmarchaeota archaeon CG_4_9_14_3_um_filter_37_18]|nr:50S ribosomal protein L1 [Candidatus Aenigmarchaeota archaeon]PIV69122.1 MAG: 50S ribosomal protein L1 [Candidatus Aenigmarchaeota archaeon CG01_land_8_20_14_3_00_37_9]PIW41306.1 MAG: 50S ribosomal protein L1 [Candidatus Aenigmarchaeota archaeon CG15_BIG_FIL_POST_REV_8_21_14_020_37_27]PIX51016.1 MAG: 50S ribosomal protein L1 [Candidatus Aenigmarchaeota archaeon CG_4_8_14_3_um_filter_37_24]PIY36226.1 MAG: 50S ribosomal protein L1 [Candidatus Aenigmarchaeota archaeon CG_4_10_14_3_um_filter_37_